MVFFIGSVRVMVIAILFIVTAIPESASSGLTIRVEHKQERKNDEAIAEQSKTDQPKSPESKDEGPTTLESKNGEPTEETAETTAEGTQEKTTEGTEEVTAKGPIELTTICLHCAFKEFGRKSPSTTPVPKIPTQEPETELPPITTPVPKIPTQEPETELPPPITPVPKILTQEPDTELPPPITPVPKIPTQEPDTELPPPITPVPKIPTQEQDTELPPPITPVPKIPTQEPDTEETEPSIPITESPFPPKGPVTEEDECSMFGKENKEPPEHCFKRTPRPPPPPPTVKPLPPPEASEKPDVGLTPPSVVLPKGYAGEVTLPPTHCPPNEVYRECDFLCQPSCKRLVRPKKCPYICIPRCLCKKPLVRRESDGKCVHRSMCPKCKKPKKKLPKCPKCKEPNGYPYDRNIFKPLTDNRRPPTDQTPPIYPEIDQEPPTDQRPPIDQGPPDDEFELSTDYEEGFYPKRPPTHQGWKKCPPQEVFSMCAGACQATCRQPRPKCARGCICRKPFVRREVDGKCVPRSKCHCKKRKGIMGRQNKELWDEH